MCEITREWVRCRVINASVAQNSHPIWATKMKERIDVRYNSSNAVSPDQVNAPHAIAYQAASRMVSEENNHEVLDTYVARVRTQIIDFFKRAHTDTSADNMIRTRLRHEANRLRREANQIRRETNQIQQILQARERASQVAMRSSTKLFTAPTPSTTIHRVMIVGLLE